MTSLVKKLVDKTCHYRDVVPVFRIEHRSLDDLEAAAARLAGGVAGTAVDGKSQIARREDRSDILLSESIRASVFHASGAVAVKTPLAPMEHLIGEKADREVLTKSTVEVAKRLQLDRLINSAEQLSFERLWLIKASGITAEGCRGREFVCRAIGAFRRHLHNLPVWGRASAFVEIAADEQIAGIGLDWRRVSAEPLDQAKVLDPERAATMVLNDLHTRLPGGEFTDDDFEVGMFSLGYFSLSKRRVQNYFEPVYVATLERRGWASMNYIIIVNGSEVTYESLCRSNAGPPRDAWKPRPGTKMKPEKHSSGWDPMVKPHLC